MNMHSKRHFAEIMSCWSIHAARSTTEPTPQQAAVHISALVTLRQKFRPEVLEYYL